ncbi:MAG TPA: LysR family transcriptional regulator [Verrucomicrobiae bacterium]|nr:LysR family transcriptional regulator [Verrucomicrobiae bacterium]
MATIRVVPRIRIVSGRDIALGPGKVELLEHIARTGSLRQASAAMEMSYMRAWTLVQTMNRCFRQPVVVTTRGGAVGGSATVTDTGKAAVALYRRMETFSLRGIRPAQRELTKLLR